MIVNLHPYTAGGYAVAGVARVGSGESSRDAQPALVIGRHYITERDSAPVQYNGIV